MLTSPKRRMAQAVVLWLCDDRIEEEKHLTRRDSDTWKPISKKSCVNIDGTGALLILAFFWFCRLTNNNNNDNTAIAPYKINNALLFKKKFVFCINYT